MKIAKECISGILKIENVDCGNEDCKTLKITYTHSCEVSFDENSKVTSEQCQASVLRDTIRDCKGIIECLGVKE
ncbi:MAG: hypothetical protein QNK36_15170 [Colwellia sp.]|nr:hypothetical protein [Colwellia sp.]